MKFITIFYSLFFSFLFNLQLHTADWNGEKETQETLFSVEVIDSTAELIDDSLEFSSTTQSYRRIQVKSEIMGKVKNVLTKAGTKINSGTQVLEMEDFLSNKELFDLKLLSESEFNKVALFAPFDGILLDGHKIEGELIMPGETAYEIIDLSKLKIFGYINENEILNISNQNEVTISILNQEVNGVIEYISPVSDPDTKTFEIVVEIDNKNLKFKDGLSSLIKIKKGDVLAHKISPSILALGDSGELGVKVIDENGLVKFKEIDILEDTSSYMVVTGLSEKEKIIIVGQQYVSNGEKVSF
jgi:multidrug efflux system membrane fusion protein